MPLKRLFVGMACAAWVSHSYAQVQNSNVGNKLSNRLLSLPAPTADGLALWVTDPSLKLEQNEGKQSLLASMRSHNQVESIAPLATYLEALPVTGRLLVARDDVAALLASPSMDYVLTGNSVVDRIAVAPLIAVLLQDGTLCQIEASASLAIEAVTNTCAATTPSDEAWVIQPDGSIHHLFTSAWNRFAGTLVAPGAMVWPVPRALAPHAGLQADVARFLATQRPSQPSRGEGVSKLAPQSTAADVERLDWKPLTSSNDWGETGLLQTPSARTGELGALRFTASRTYPYTRTNVFMQPTGWLEFGFRYTDIATALYGANIAGQQTYKDKSLDFKAVLSKEQAYWPQIALGMRDIGGTGLFSSEYLVASKRTEAWDWSLGLGWGKMASGRAFANPLGELFPGLKTRKSEAVGQGGTISGASMFAGDAALFGGVQWTSPAGKHALKLEYDSNDYASEPFGENFGASSPFNVGWVYRVSPGLDISLALERGNKVSLALTLGGNIRTTATPKPLDPQRQTSAQLATARMRTVPANAGTAGPEVRLQQIQKTIRAQTGWSLKSLELVGAQWELTIETDDAVYAHERLERLFATLATELPATADSTLIHLQNFGLPLRTVQFNRTEWLAKQVYPDLPSLQLSAQEWLRPQARTPDPLPQASRLETGWGTTFSPILGGPNSFLLYQAGLRAYGQYRFDENTLAFAQANLRLLDNYDTFAYDAPSNLPRVRTDQRSYVTTSRTTIPVAQVTRTFDMGDGHYASAYGGLLEPMYAGLGAEWLWRPWNASWAVGVDVNQVQQRKFEQDLGLRDYRTTTGHATLYWNTGIEGVLAKISAGKYLANDTGVTIDLSRSFTNGTSIGVWATKTNVSAEQFGEGSFDKGLYMNIPFDAMLPRSTPSMANIVWNPLTRDGGAKLSRRFGLFDLTRHADSAAWRYRTSTEENANAEVRQESSSLFGALFPARSGRGGLADSMDLGPGMAHGGVDYKAVLAGGGVVLLTMAADEPIADALGKDGSTFNPFNAFNNVPYLLAAGVGAAAVGTWGEDVRTTAYASISAATWALGANLVTKAVVGRSRPDENLGPWAFNGPSSSSSQSSFASNHVTVAMALATPFAKRYNQPWLYGLAALTGLGRVQSKEHWASDTVAGGMLGYAFGSLALEQQADAHSRWSLSGTANQVSAVYKY
jgi:membrane-associated phospholipid phosphatase